jgi:triphosphoribosyl-dephospho-CoA synthase
MQLTTSQCAALACLLEIAAPKPGNVHRGADFEDVSFTDFAASSVAIGPAMERAPQGVGAAALAAVQATREIAATNTNLGIILLLAPLAACASATQSEAARVLASLDAEDSRLVYEAIRLAQPGGLGKEQEMDVAGEAPADLLAAMRHAADRDLVARQYVNGFEQVFHCAAPWLVEGRSAGWPMSTAIVHAHLRMMSEFPDSLIARKCTAAAAKRAADMAAHALASGTPDDESFWRAVGDLDFWLRSDGHRRNPGTTADLITAGLFVCLRRGLLQPPWR